MGDEEAATFIKKPAEVSHAPTVIAEEFIGVDENGTVQIVYMKLPENTIGILRKLLLPVCGKWA